MKLFALALLAAVALAVAVPAPQVETTTSIVSSPDTRQFSKITLEPSQAATGDSPSPSEFWTYSVTITESYDLDQLVVTCDFQNALGRAKLDFVDSAHILTVKVNDEYLWMQYDYNKHWASYAFDKYHWGMDMYSATTHGFCKSDDGWNKAPLEKNSYDFRQISLSCWIYLGNQASATQSITKAAVARTAARSSEDIPGPNDTVLYNVTFAPKSSSATGTIGDLPPYNPDFWSYEVTVTEGWADTNLVVTAVLITGAGAYAFTFTPDKMLWIHINKKYLQMTYNYGEHRIWFKYDGYDWALDMYSGSPHGLCHVISNWNKDVLPEGSQELRQITSGCWIYVKGNEESASARRHLEDVDARGVSSASNITVDTTGYFQFDLSVTEYCEASEGTPLKARAYWTPHGGSGGESINFDDGHSAIKVDIGYATDLQVGPYDYWTHRVHFNFGGCNWDQDIDGVEWCGFCHPGPWSAGELNCATNAAAGRYLHLDCYAGVQFDTASQDRHKLLAARKVANPVVTIDAHATITRTLVPQDITTQTAAGTSVTTMLPFHFYVTESCEDGEKKVTGHYENNDLSTGSGLLLGREVGVAHLVPRFPPFVVGPFDINTGRLRFAYSNGPISCEWFDDETSKQCGECRAKPWSGPAFDCTSGGSRTKEMDCSFIMVT